MPNAPECMLSVLAGMAIEASAVQDSKALSPIFSIVGGRTTSSKLSQPSNASSLIAFTPSGISIFFNPDWRKALSPIDSRVEGSSISVRLEHSRNALSPMEVRPSGKVIFSKAVLANA